MSGHRLRASLLDAVLRRSLAVAALAGGTAIVHSAAASVERDAGSWSSLGDGISGNHMNMHTGVKALAVFDDGLGQGDVLYAGGNFDTAGTAATNGVARWDGSEWHGVPGIHGGLGGSGAAQIRAMAVMPFPEGERLVVGGILYFGEPVPFVHQHVASWDGTEWKPLHPSRWVTEIVSDLTVVEDPTAPFGRALLVIGRGISVVDEKINGGGQGLWRFDGIDWSQVGPSINNGGLPSGAFSVAAHRVGDGVEIFIASGKTMFLDDGTSIGQLARLVDGQWQPVPGLVESPSIRRLHGIMYRGEPVVVAVGLMRLPGDWRQYHALMLHGLGDGAAGADALHWRPIGGPSIGSGGGLDWSGFAVIDDGVDADAVYLAGWFTMIGGTPLNRAGRFNGAFWTEMDRGISNQPPPEEGGLAGSSDEFDSDWFFDGSAGDDEGGLAANPPPNIAAFIRDPFAPADAPRVIAAGSFYYAGATAASNIAAYTPPADPRPGPFPFRCAASVGLLPDAIGTLRDFNDHDVVALDGSTDAIVATEQGATYFPVPWRGWTVTVRSIGADGHLTGSAGSNGSQGFVLDPSSGMWSLIGSGAHPCNGCGGYAIGSDGTVHGRDVVDDPQQFAHFTDDGFMYSTTLPPESSSSPTPVAANAHGHSVGRFFHAGRWSPYFFDGEQIHPLPIPDEGSSQVTGMNDYGAVVGHTYGAFVTSEPLLWLDGEPVALPGLDGPAGQPRSINNDGTIVGVSNGEPTIWFDGVPESLRPRYSWLWQGAIQNPIRINNNGSILVHWSKRFGTNEGSGAILRLHEPRIGDIDGDCVVDGYDLGILLAEWGRSDSVADLNGDGIVDGADLGLLLMSWGGCEGPDFERASERRR